MSEDNADAQTSNHESPAPGRRWLSGALTSLMLICFALSGWLWLQAPRPNQAVAVAAELPPHRADKGNETKNIEDVRLGERVVGRNPLREQTQLPSDIRPETHRVIRLEMIQHEALYELSFVRSLTWLQEQNAQAGESIPFVMEEMGLNALARVISIEPCPEIEPDDGTGRMVVTGTMKHLAGNVLEIQTEGDAEPLGVTGTHPIWSVDRQDFVVASQLEIGESLEQADGTVTQITRITPTRGPPVMVYNLEIDAEHVFRVGDDGVLVHNSCPNTVPGAPKNPGRSGKQARLRELANDPNVSKADRGWIKQELNSIRRGQRTNIRVPPGKNLAHRRGFGAKDGFGYKHSDLQDIDLHKLQHGIEGY